MFLRTTSVLALLTLPFALADASNVARRLPFLVLLLALPHLAATFGQNHARIGLAFGSSAILFVGLVFNTLLSLVRFFPVEGSSWPWLAGAIAHALMLIAAFLERHGDQSGGQPEFAPHALLGSVYSIISIPLVQFLAKANR